LGRIRLDRQNPTYRAPRPFQVKSRFKARMRCPLRRYSHGGQREQRRTGGTGGRCSGAAVGVAVTNDHHFPTDGSGGQTHAEVFGRRVAVRARGWDFRLSPPGVGLLI